MSLRRERWAPQDLPDLFVKELQDKRRRGNRERHSGSMADIASPSGFERKTSDQVGPKTEVRTNQNKPAEAGLPERQTLVIPRPPRPRFTHSRTRC